MRKERDESLKSRNRRGRIEGTSRQCPPVCSYSSLLSGEREQEKSELNCRSSFFELSTSGEPILTTSGEPILTRRNREDQVRSKIKTGVS